MAQERGNGFVIYDDGEEAIKKREKCIFRPDELLNILWQQCLGNKIIK